MEKKRKMKRLAQIAICVLIGLLAGCGKSKPVLHLYCWADYISPDLIRTFEKVNNCRVIYDTFDSNEAMVAKLQAGATGYDIIFPSHYVVNSLAESGKLAEIDQSKLICLDNLDKELLAAMPDSACKYSVPYTLSYTGIGYNKDAVKDFKPSWTMFNRSDLQRRATLLDDKREVIGAALLTAGLDPNSTKPEDLLKAKEIIKVWIGNVSKFENEQYKNGLASNEFHLVMGYSGDLMQIIEENPSLAFVIPDEGALMSCDVMVIPATAPNPDLAYAFINFIHDPTNAAENIEYTCYLSPNKAAYPLLPDSIKKNPAIFLDRKILEKSRFTIDQKEGEAAFNKLWEDIKAGR